METIPMAPENSTTTTRMMERKDRRSLMCRCPDIASPTCAPRCSLTLLPNCSSDALAARSCVVALSSCEASPACSRLKFWEVLRGMLGSVGPLRLAHFAAVAEHLAAAFRFGSPRCQAPAPRRSSDSGPRSPGRKRPCGQTQRPSPWGPSAPSMFHLRRKRQFGQC